MIGNPYPVAVIYEADFHCVSCAEQRFGQALYESGRFGAKVAEDSEGNQPSPIFSWEIEEPEHCGTCGREIE